MNAKDELSSGMNTLPFWKLLLERYPAPFMYTAISSIDLATALVSEWLGSCMFDKEDPDGMKRIESISKALNEHNDSKTHSRHFDIDFCKKIGLNIVDLEEDQNLQDAVLSLHHAYIFTLDNTAAVKIIENQHGKALVSMTKS